MKQKQFMDLLLLGEGFTTEFKRSGTSGLGREICAFANATGGVILIGVTDAGEVVGVGNHNRLKSEVQAIARSADPPVTVEVSSAGKVLCVAVPEQHGKPYSFGGKFFIREGGSSQQMSREEIRAFFYKEGLVHFDETPCDRFSLSEDLTEDVWELFCRRANIPEEMDQFVALENLHLLDNGRMTHTGAWLLAGMTEANLGVRSVPRNPLLFGMLHRMSAVEHIGSGIPRIHALCREYGVPEPRIEVSEHWFTITFLRPTTSAAIMGPGRDQEGTKSGPGRAPPKL